MKIYNECCNIYYGFSPFNRWATKFLITFVLLSVLWTFIGAMVNGEEKKEEPKQETSSFTSCNNPAGCAGKFPKGTDWPVCPICNTPISSVVDVSKNGNIAEEIVYLFEETRSLHDEIEKIKDKRYFEEQERIKNLKAYNVAYAEKVRDNMRVLTDAYVRTKTFLEKGGEIPDMPLDNKIKNGDNPVWVITGFLRGKPVWKKVEDFPIYPRPK